MKKEIPKRSRRSAEEIKNVAQGTIVIDDTAYKTRLTKKYQNRKPFEELDLGKLIAFIPGSIIDVFVKENDLVKEGDLLAVLEAMKMHNQIKAPFDATVSKVNAKKGDNVPKNYVIIELKPVSKS